ncbi:MAG: PVC-type heme-binding CxxCH protein [Planctomycetaceae bacterium]
MHDPTRARVGTATIRGAILPLALAAALGAGAVPAAEPAKPAWQSPVVDRDTPGRRVPFAVELRGATRVWLEVADGGDGYGCDWADWIEPAFEGPEGTKTPLADLDWRRATTEWGEVRKGRSAGGGALRVDGKEVRGIGTHANSVIEFEVPQGATRLVGAGGLDDGGAEQGAGSIRFAVHTQAPPVRGAPAGGPVAAADAPGVLVTAEGLEATLFAAEPLLSSPSDIDVDAAGRVWVCEVTNYRGKKDHRPEGDRILVLEDTDGDGTADRSTVFHQGRDVDSALGICVIGEGPGRRVIVSCAPEVIVFHDDDGDLVADRKESLFTKTGDPQHDHSVHAFSVGPDGRWYFNFGNTGHAVHDARGEPVVDRLGNAVNDSGRPYRQGMVFRCLPDGTGFEVLGHNFRNNYEVAVDSFGTLWQSDNDDDGNRGVRINFVMEGGNYGYVDERTGAGWQVPRTNLETEVPDRHWHQNDPGVVPNLLLTGGGSPTGICVYEGTLLPERFHGALVHCDAGPNVVRAYHVSPAGAGYAATSETIVDGAADRWFRPSDVCVAPDGSLIVADWYDPGVGGHGMGDTEKGRIYRIAPPGSRWTVPRADLTSVAGAAAALESPNLATRACALERLRQEPGAAIPALAAALRDAADARHAARLAWALGMLPEGAGALVPELLRSTDPDLRIVALRVLRATGGDVAAAVETLAADPSPAVRREAAVALRGLAGRRADEAWAALAAAHVAGDRWETEALGIGAAGAANTTLWDARLAAWLARVGNDWKNAAGREIVWRSRAVETPRMLCELVAAADVTAPEALALVRSLDFQDPAAAATAVRGLLSAAGAAWSEEKLAVVLPELVMRLDPAAKPEGKLAERIAAAAAAVPGTQAFVDIVSRFRLGARAGDLVALAAAPGTSDPVAASALGAAFDLGAADAVHAAIAAAAEAETRPAEDPRRARAAGDSPAPEFASAARLLEVAGLRGQGPALEVVLATIEGADVPPALRAAAVRGLARTQGGARRLVEMAKEGRLTGSLPQAAAAAISAGPWGDVRQAAADVLPLPRARGGAALPPVAELVKRGGSAEKGKGVFAGAGTCAKCHVVAGEGKMVGPDLSGVGAKLSREALWESVLAPSAAISHNYEAFTALTHDGRAISGLLVSRTPAEVVIRGADGTDTAVAAADLEDLVRQPVSLMPADLASTLTAEELVDLVAYLETLRGAK